MRIDISGVQSFVEAKSFENIVEKVLTNLKNLLDRKGLGSEFTGWIDLPERYLDNKFKEIVELSENFSKFQTVVLIGTGGSYLGARAAIELLKTTNSSKKPGAEILYAGQNLSADYYNEIINYLQNKDFGLVVISKSGNTIEPAIAFRILYDFMKKKYSKKQIKERLLIVTDANKGSLRNLVNQEKFNNLAIEDNVGGRYSVLSAVGLVPAAIAGLDIKQLLSGALYSKKTCVELSPENIAVKYSAVRNSLYRNGHYIEILANYHEKFLFFSEWWKQLFGESEGKNLNGIFPASVYYTADLHSLGQYIQQGKRNIFETVLYVTKNQSNMIIPKNESDFDKLNYLSGKDIEFINRVAAEATYKAHLEGGVPNIWIEIPEINEYNIGSLFYFFEISCAISAYTFEVNPFDQPGVEHYKKYMSLMLKK